MGHPLEYFFKVATRPISIYPPPTPADPPRPLLQCNGMAIVIGLGHGMSQGAWDIGCPRWLGTKLVIGYNYSLPV